MGTTNNENEDDGTARYEAWREQAASDEDVRNMAGMTSDKLDGVRREIGRIASELRRLGR